MLRFSSHLYCFYNLFPNKFFLKNSNSILVQSRNLQNTYRLKEKQVENRLEEEEFKLNVKKFSKGTTDNLENNTLSEEVYKELKSNIISLIKKLNKRENFTSLKSQKLQNSMQNLKTVYTEVIEETKDSEMTAIGPSKIFLQIVGNGAYNLSNSLIIRTDTNSYLINIPENAARILRFAKVKASNLNDIFVTRRNANNILGLQGLLTNRENEIFTNSLIRLHGLPNFKKFYTDLRPIALEDYGLVKPLLALDEISPEKGSFSDDVFDIKYIPIINSGNFNDVSYCYLFEGKLPARKMNPLKLLELQIPKGKWLHRLKLEETVTLPDGRIIKPDDILFDLDLTNEKTNLLILDIQSINEIDSLRISSHLFPYIDKKKSLNYIVHIVEKDVYESDEYQKFMNDISCNDAKNIICNETATFFPDLPALYHNTQYLNSICPDLYQNLYNNDSLNSYSIFKDSNTGDNFITAKPYSTFVMRGTLPAENTLEISFDVAASSFGVPVELKTKFEQLLNEFKEECKNDTLIRNGDIYPELVVLGTSSAVPTKYRNVSSYLLRTSEHSSFLIDAGEGTFSQLFFLYGPNKIDEVIMNIKAVLITHVHQDHINGLWNIVMKRKEIFERNNVPYIPLIVAGPPKFNIFSSNLYGTKLDYNQIIDVKKLLPSSLFNKEEFNLASIYAVPVKHAGFALGYIFIDEKGRKFVFSGDTMPCDGLAENGKNADVLVHEATFEDQQADEALKKKHSTMEQAVAIGEKMKAKNILLTHFSARFFKIPRMPDYLDEKNVGIGFDFMRIRFNQWHLVTKLNKILRLAFASEIFELESKLNQQILNKTFEKSKRKIKETDLPPSKKFGYREKNIMEEKNVATETTDKNNTMDTATDIVKRLKFESPNPLSKKQQKKQARREKYLEKRKEKRVLEKERRKERNKMMRENNIPIPSRKSFKKMADSNCKVRVAIDMSFDNYMSDANIKSTMIQLQFCYGYNRRAENPMQLYIVGLKGKGKEEFSKQSDNNSWDVYSTSKSLTEMFPKDELVYLTADSENDLEDIDDGKIYVIGGLLDHNSCPKLTLEMANIRGIKHAKLPIGNYMRLKTRNVLTINQVYDIILKYTETKNWEDAFLKVIPVRKGIQKIENNKTENEKNNADNSK